MLAGCGTLPGSTGSFLPSIAAPTATPGAPALLPPPVPKPTRASRAEELEPPTAAIAQPTTDPSAATAVSSRPLPPIPIARSGRSLTAEYPDNVIGASPRGRVTLPPKVSDAQVRAEVQKLSRQAKAKALGTKKSAKAAKTKKSAKKSAKKTAKPTKKST